MMSLAYLEILANQKSKVVSTLFTLFFSIFCFQVSSTKFILACRWFCVMNLYGQSLYLLRDKVLSSVLLSSFDADGEYFYNCFCALILFW